MKKLKALEIEIIDIIKVLFNIKKNLHTQIKIKLLPALIFSWLPIENHK